MTFKYAKKLELSSDNSINSQNKMNHSLGFLSFDDLASLF